MISDDFSLLSLKQLTGEVVVGAVMDVNLEVIRKGIVIVITGPDPIAQ